MKVHEYQAKELFRQFNIPVPEGRVAHTVEEAVQVAQGLAGPKYVVKAQIHAGGRGKGGGVKVVSSLDEVKTAAEAILGMQLVTHQTGPEGQTVRKLLIENGSAIDKELYISIILDRAVSKPVIMASTEGGMDIEEVAEKTHKKIVREYIDPLQGIQPYNARKIAFALGIPASCFKETVQLIMGLYNCFWQKDCSLVEVNPLVITTDGQIIALDGKVNIDDNALYRHKDIADMRDEHEEDPLEVEASRYHLNYIKLDGNVGCMVNGAGLAMATMDIIKLYGAAPANFLDVGGSASEEAIENAFRILLSDQEVKAVLINIFGGILRCDKFASGVVAAAKNLNVTLPIVVRMKGTNVEEGQQILRDSGLAFEVADTMQEAAEKVAGAVKNPVVA